MAATLTRTLLAEQRAEQVRTAWRYRQEGWTQDRIAVALRVDRSTVSRLLKRQEELLLKEFVTEVERVKLRQMLVLETIRDKALQQFDRSCEDAVILREIKRTKNGIDGEGNPTSETLVESYKEIRAQTGDPALFAQARGAEADIRKIWGLDAPKSLELTGAFGGAILIREVVVELPPDASPDGAEKFSADPVEG